MIQNAFNRRLTLLELKSDTGHRNSFTELSRADVWAAVSEPGVTTKMTALAAGVEVEYSVVMWRSEFKGFTHAELDGVRYKITQTGGTESPLKIRLLLQRG